MHDEAEFFVALVGVLLSARRGWWFSLAICYGCIYVNYIELCECTGLFVF